MNKEMKEVVKQYKLKKAKQAIDLRNKKLMSFPAVAKAMGVARQTVYNWINLYKNEQLKQQSAQQAVLD
jgi:transposase